jgi:hypothetical protein
MARAFSFTASGSIAQGNPVRIIGANLCGGIDAATGKVIGAVTNRVYLKLGAGAGASADLAPAEAINVDEKDTSLTVTVTGTTPDFIVYVG